MSCIHMCDLCGKPMSIDGRGVNCYKIKERWTRWGEHGWITIEAHDECVRELLDNAYARKRAMEGK